MTTRLAEASESNKQLYINWSEKQTELPVFLNWWWIDATTSSKWSAVFSFNKDGTIRAAWPYKIESILTIKISRMPKQTQHLGPWILENNTERYAKKLAYEKEVLTDLLKKLPKFSLFKQKLNIKIVNWLPLYWNDFDSTTMYTYRLNLQPNIDTLFQHLESNVRTDIKKAQLKVQIEETDDIELFYKINQMSFERQGKKIPYSLEFAKKIDLNLSKRGQRRITLAIDNDDSRKVHAGIYTIWDSNSAYYLWSGADPVLRNSGATSLLLWDSIVFCKQKVEYFDFEGSMIEPVEKFVRAFGAKQVPYFAIQKRSFIFQIVDLFRGKIK